MVYSKKIGEKILIPLFTPNNLPRYEYTPPPRKVENLDFVDYRSALGRFHHGAMVVYWVGPWLVRDVTLGS